MERYTVSSIFQHCTHVSSKDIRDFEEKNTSACGGDHETLLGRGESRMSAHEHVMFPYRIQIGRAGRGTVCTGVDSGAASFAVVPSRTLWNSYRRWRRMSA